jgi:hypothetical protein
LTVAVVAQPRKVAVFAVVGAGLVGLGLLVALFHLDHLGYTFCTFKHLTGHPCMTCGTTRALGRLIVGDVLGAARVNPLSTAVMLGLVAFVPVDLALQARGRSLVFETSPRERRWLVGAGVLLLLVNWAYLIANGV